MCEFKLARVAEDRNDFSVQHLHAIFLFFFILIIPPGCQVLRLNKATHCEPGRSQSDRKQLLISDCLSSLHHFPVVGDFMSELVIITGDWILTFLLRSISEGAAILVRPSVAIWECLRSEVRGIFTSASHCFISFL